MPQPTCVRTAYHACIFCLPHAIVPECHRNHQPTRPCEHTARTGHCARVLNARGFLCACLSVRSLPGAPITRQHCHHASPMKPTFEQPSNNSSRLKPTWHTLVPNHCAKAMPSQAFRGLFTWWCVPRTTPTLVSCHGAAPNHDTVLVTG
ncbi:hypothetical protein TorRG33x02_236920 [Trema orientale]|uniref:Uncharacterized protein n=1 Tax=Trema orientale TaxID=63057 RepID=A0A2P5DZY6_TREOI|nr:hypothetical protein TorRG33x02_236920 [Trema orientale]